VSQAAQIAVAVDGQDCAVGRGDDLHAFVRIQVDPHCSVLLDFTATDSEDARALSSEPLTLAAR
jgi:hypothetical protein